jgi:hypothetical protein
MSPWESTLHSSVDILAIGDWAHVQRLQRLWETALNLHNCTSIGGYAPKWISTVVKGNQGHVLPAVGLDSLLIGKLILVCRSLEPGLSLGLIDFFDLPVTGLGICLDSWGRHVPQLVTRHQQLRCY